MIKKNQLKAGIVLSYISMGLGYVISIIYTPVMLRILGQSEYGLYSLVASVVSYLSLFSFGFGGAYIRYYFKFKSEDDHIGIARLNGMFFVVFSVIGLVALIAGIILTLNVSFIFGDKLNLYEINKAKILMVIMVFNIAITFPNSVFNSYIIANEEYVFQKILQVVKTVINPLITLPILLLGYNSVGMVVVSTIISICIEVSNIIFCFKKLKIKFLFKQFDISLMKEITVFSSFIFMNIIIDQLNWNVDKFIIGRIRGTVSVAVYGIASQINSYYFSFSSVISSVFIPTVNRMVASSTSNTELTNLFVRIGRLQFIVLSLFCSGFIFFGKPFIHLWLGDDYTEVYVIVLLLIIPVTIPLMQNIGIEIQKAKNMHQFRSWLYLFVAIGNVIISIPLTKAYGPVGAALGTAITVLLGTGLIMNLYYHTKLGLNMKFFWYQIFKFVPSLLLPIIAGIVIRTYVNLNYLLSFLISGVIYVCVFCVSMWLFGMNKDEKMIIYKPLIKVLKKVRLF